MENITYLRATTADIALMVDYRIAFSDDLLGKLAPETETMMRRNLEKYFREQLDKGYICWYALVGDEVASIAGLVIRVTPPNLKNPTGIWGYIMNVYTVPQHRGKGLSGEVLNRMMSTAEEMGVTAFELHATPAGEPVYRKCGFEIHPEPTYRKYATK